MALKKRALWSALCCLGSFDVAEMNQLLVVSRLMGGDFDADATGLRKAMRAAGRSKRQGLEVLHGGSEKELVACTRERSQPHGV